MTLRSVAPDWDDLARRFAPLTEQPVDGSPRRARELDVDLCSVDHARDLISRWHSRLPVTQRGPWTHAFRAHWRGYTYAVALWNNPSARTLPRDWLELRRMAVAPDAPHCTASRMLGQMARWLSIHTAASRLISYQDDDVHTGTIYLAANWQRTTYAAPRERQRKGYARPARLAEPNSDDVSMFDLPPTHAAKGGREYRSSINGAAPDVAGKWRWEFEIGGAA